MKTAYANLTCLQSSSIGIKNLSAEMKNFKNPLETRGTPALTHLYCSPMTRAVQTALEVARGTGLRPRIWADWHESGGIWLEKDGVRVGLEGQSRAYFEQRFPNVAKRLAHSANLLSADAELLAPIIAAHAAHCIDGKQLLVSQLLVLENGLATHVVRYWLAKYGQSMPGSAALNEFILQLGKQRPGSDAQLVSTDYALRVWNKRIFICKKQSAEPDAEFDYVWDGKQALALPRGGSLSWHGTPPCITRVCYRRGAEKIQLPGRAHHHSVKKCLSTLAPPWQRDSLPFVYNEQGELLAVGDYLLSEPLQQFQQQYFCTLTWQDKPE